MAIGFTITTFGLYRMTNVSLNIPFHIAVSWRVVIALGLPFLFIPINTLCYAGIPQEKYNEVSGMSALMCNLGGSVGISFVTTLLARFTQKHSAMLNAHTVNGNGPFEAIRNGLTSESGCGTAELVIRKRPSAREHRSMAWPRFKRACCRMSMSSG